MAQQNPDNPSPLLPGEDPLETEPMAVEQPRRAASARFVVESEVGSAAALREAMDPANQSLADALHLSFRVLQVVIVVLVGLFLISGFRTVKTGQSGVMLRFGKIVEDDGQQALEPGLRRNLLPYPVGEFDIFEVENLSVDLGNTFWPPLPPNMTLERAIDSATIRGVLKPGEIGSLITSDGDLAHLKLTAAYEISDPVRYVHTVRNIDDDRRMVTLALQRAVVQTTSALTLQDLVEQPEEAQDRIRQKAQRVLDTLDCGIQLTDVQLNDAKPPFAIVQVYRDLQNAREESREAIEKARQDADQKLIRMAGGEFAELSRLINQYEEAEDLGNSDQAAALLSEINDAVESDRIRGQVREIIGKAKGYEAEVERTLGNEARRFATVRPSFDQHPALEVKRLWAEAYKAVVNRNDAEIFRVIGGLASINVGISGSEKIQKIRRRNRQEKQKRDAEREAAGILRPYGARADEFEIGEAAPMMEVDEEGRIRPKGSRR